MNINLKLFKNCSRPCYFKLFTLKIHNWRVLFFGSDAFSIYSLQKLCQVYQETRMVKKLDVVTTIGAKINHVKKFSDEKGLTVLKWPPDLGQSVEKSYDLGIVVSFGHLIPKKIIDYFPLGMINVHASLLPRWRGASPIIHSMMNGDEETGVTIMRINPHHFDTGDIILQKHCAIGKDELMPSLYERLGNLGSDALIETLEGLPRSLQLGTAQSNSNASKAPRIDSSIADVRWSDSTAIEIYNKFRALYSVYELRTRWHGVPVRLKKLRPFSTEPPAKQTPGTVLWDKRDKQIRVVCSKGSIIIDSLSVGGKSLRSVDFYNGYLSKKLEKNWIFD